ncbi:hypothetical protein M758_UG021300 [Ceratodon purpureus]|nr:hypothetical protein M758_UG021300 [Ceratodon purpureus]
MAAAIANPPSRSNNGKEKLDDDQHGGNSVADEGMSPLCVGSKGTDDVNTQHTTSNIQRPTRGGEGCELGTTLLVEACREYAASKVSLSEDILHEREAAVFKLHTLVVQLGSALRLGDTRMEKEKAQYGLEQVVSRHLAWDGREARNQERSSVEEAARKRVDEAEADSYKMWSVKRMGETEIRRLHWEMSTLRRFSTEWEADVEGYGMRFFRELSRDVVKRRWPSRMQA